jgi:hypothetical protein
MRSSQGLFVVSLALGVSGCVDPQGDYNDYIKRTDKYRSSSEAGVIDSTAPTNAIKATYYLACLPNLAFGDISKLFRFYAESEFTPAVGGGKLTYHLTPMRIRDDAGALLPAGTLTFKKEALGTLTVTDTPVATNGKFVANFMTAMVAATSNPISFRDITVANTTVTGIFQSAPDGGPGDYCGGLSGNVTAPITQDLGAAADNVCLFKPMKDGDPLPVIVVSDFMCPGI